MVKLFAVHFPSRSVSAKTGNYLIFCSSATNPRDGRYVYVYFVYAYVCFFIPDIRWLDLYFVTFHHVSFAAMGNAVTQLWEYIEIESKWIDGMNDSLNIPSF